MTTDRRSPSAVVFGLAAIGAAALLAAFVATAPAAAQPRAATRSFMWKATRQQGVVYLVGSVHMLTKDFYPLATPLEAGFKDSDLLVEEVDLAEMLTPETQFSLLARGMLPAGQTLDKVISPATMALVKGRTDGLGMPASALQQFKPWFLAMTLMAVEWEKAGFDASLGLDKHFYDRAQVEGKAVQGLETTDYQISRFDGMTASQQDKFLAESLKDLDAEKASVGRIADAWKIGDLPTVERLVLEDVKDDPFMYQRLLVERNRNWLPKIDALFARPGHAFVVVGAAHLVGPDGLIAMLRTKGARVEQQ
jgi:uncharacterized protein YbaP (TraB family)